MKHFNRSKIIFSYYASLDINSWHSQNNELSLITGNSVKHILGMCTKFSIAFVM